MSLISLLFLAFASVASAFVAVPAALGRQVGPVMASPAAFALGSRIPSRLPLQAKRASDTQMGLFGLGAPELAVIGAVALFILGPDQLKKLAKDVGKVSAELKQVPEEFNKGMETGQAELDKKKAEAPAAAPIAEAKTEETPPPAA